MSKFDNPAVTKDSDGATAEARNSQDCAAPKFRALDIGVISNTDWSDSDLVMFNYTREFDAKIVQKFCSTMASLKPPKHRFLSHLNSTDKVGCVFTKIQSGDNWIALFVDRIGERTLDLEKMLAAGSSLMREPSSCGNVFSKSLIARLRSNDSFLIVPTSPH